MPSGNRRKQDSAKTGQSHIGNVVKKLISGFEKKEKEEKGLYKAWETAAGRKAAGHTKPVFVKEKRLVVKVSDSAWLYKLTMEKENLLRKFNRGAKKRKKINRIQFRIGDIHGEKERKKG